MQSSRGPLLRELQSDAALPATSWSGLGLVVQDLTWRHKVPYLAKALEDATRLCVAIALLRCRNRYSTSDGIHQCGSRYSILVLKILNIPIEAEKYRGKVRKHPECQAAKTGALPLFSTTSTPIPETPGPQRSKGCQCPT